MTADEAKAMEIKLIDNIYWLGEMGVDTEQAKEIYRLFKAAQERHPQN